MARKQDKKTKYKSIQNQLKTSNGVDRFLISLDRVCLTANKYFKPLSVLPEHIYGLVSNKQPKSILVIDDPTVLLVDSRLRRDAEITVALSRGRIPEDKFDLAKKRILNYCKSYNINVKRVVRLEDLLKETK